MLLWNFAAALLSSLYTGEIQSLLVVPRKQVSLRTFEDLVKHGHHIQIRGNQSSTYALMKKSEVNHSLIRCNKYLVALAKTADLASENHHQFLDHLASKRKTAAMNTVEKVKMYLGYLRKYYASSECVKGEEPMFVSFMGNIFIAPYSAPLRKVSDQLYESGISQLYEGITKMRLKEYDDSRLTRTYKDTSAEGLTQYLDFSLADPQGKVAFYLALIGLGIGVTVLWGEMAWNARHSWRVNYYKIRVFFRSLLGCNDN